MSSYYYVFIYSPISRAMRPLCRFNLREDALRYATEKGGIVLADREATTDRLNQLSERYQEAVA